MTDGARIEGVGQVLVTGKGTSGSWQIRGVQLGGAIGATVKANATLEDMKRHDVVILVKRAGPVLAESLRRCGRIVVWDAVDAWRQQPYDQSSRDELCAWAWAFARSIGAEAIIGATRRMASDLGSPYYVPHHGWDRGVGPLADRIHRVGYEGSPRYISSLLPSIRAACKAIGATFEVNPPDFHGLDVVLAMRGAEWTNYASRHWKSGVKLSNAQMAGLPFVAERECGYTERACGGERWIESARELTEALRSLQPKEQRARMRRNALDGRPRLEACAADMIDVLRSCCRVRSRSVRSR